MGKIVSINNQEIGYYQNGEVKNTRGEVLAYYNESNGDIYRLNSVANNYFAVYQYGKIYRKKGFSQTKVGDIISGKDWSGHDGKIVDNSGNTVAFYEGEDCIGLGAAAAALVFRLYESNGSASSSDGGCIVGAIELIFGLILRLLTFSFTPVIGVAVIGLTSEMVLAFVPYIIIALCLFDARKKGLISKRRGYVAAILQNLLWIMLFLGFIPFFEVLLSPIMKNNYIGLIIHYMPYLSFLIVWTGVRKHKKAIKKQKKLLKKQEKERKKQEKLQAKNNNT